MLLRDLIHEIYSEEIPAQFLAMDITGIQSDSRKVQPGNLFVALQGPLNDGEKFIPQAIAKGAVAIARGKAENSSFAILTLKVEDPRKFLHQLAQRFFHDPQRQLKIVGVTGTNGKTTITYLLESIAQHVKKKSGVIGTINYRIGHKIFPANNTTPGILDTYQLWFQMAHEGMDYCFMEVSSHALEQQRVIPSDFHSAIFTNLTGDHLDYHVNMENYFLAKAKLFISLPSQSTAIINQDDVYGPRLVGLTQSKISTYAIKQKADVMAKDILLDMSGSRFVIVSPEGEIKIHTRLIGQHNIYNILAVTAEALAQGISLQEIGAAIEGFELVPGRLERVNCSQKFSVFVDYAHTEDALKNVLTSLKQIKHRKIIVVFGCGGDRDRTKRPKMGKVASELADVVILTNDNSRSEEPQDIVNEIIKGISNKTYKVILDRQKAIEEALESAGDGDIVLLAGKGHETYQIFKNETIHFDDRDVVRHYLNRK